MPIRNPFARRPGGNLAVQDENVRPGSSSAGSGSDDPAHPGFERVDTVGSKASSALSIGSRRSQDTGEYKMSVVNDSGVYLPPSPVEKEATWPRRYLSRTSSDRSSVAEIEHFSISRESFDSYRRSFDICAKSPIVVTDPAPRQSLDSTRFARMPRSALGERRFEREPPTPEENFEEVGLNDESNSKSSPFAQAPKKRGFFAKFGSDATADNSNAAGPVSTTGGGVTSPAAAQGGMSRFLPGRKRGQSGQGAELGAMPVIYSPPPSSSMNRPPTSTSASLQPQEVQS
ncbi:hypothetical protein B0T24DRAFT_373915 [Lasiosphaeria ovina]|uniref:Uncharacterized protein n=1 Tax=Lasiosphaeria ovina TaxID=92902 RepID=A0AAE0N177_9PEZI|nr:hypothetical protein B0T24DRAFT_373915 [Lasiosphaeria ovina]